LSPDGSRALASIGSSHDNDLRLELIDLVHGESTVVSKQYWRGAWSPDGKWIAAETGSNSLSLLSAADFSRVRGLGYGGNNPQWSPDSRFLLVEKHYFSRCGFFLDVDGPATAELVDVQTGRRSVIRSSDCRMENGWAGWVHAGVIH